MLQAVPHLEPFARWTCHSGRCLTYQLYNEVPCPVDATQQDTEDPMEAIIKHSPITCNGPIYSTYGNSPLPVAVYCMHLLCQR